MRSYHVLPGALLVLALTAGACSPRAPSDSSAGQDICASLMGAGNLASVSGSMASKDVEYASTGIPLQNLLADLPAEGRTWRPGDDYYARESAPCVFGPADSRQSLTVEVGWFGAPFRSLQSDWHRAGGDVLSGWWLHEDDSRYAFPCKISGSHAGQQEQIPLSVRLHAKNLDGFTPELRSRVAAAVARTMATRLHCVNKPTIPARLTTPAYRPSHPSPSPTSSPRYSTRSTHSPGQAPAPA
ncbi:hypothetical protein [Streptomyces sp. NPDC058657]|uniref:hypothetical protein n=1 Tax=unclassified Streptomyces TaxID=2593676 RepID=UPI00364B21BD